MQQNLQAALYGEGREIHQCALPGNVGHLSIPFKRTPYTDLKHIEQQGRVRFWPLLLPLGLPGAYAVGERQWRDEGHENHHDFTSSFHSVMVWCDGMILKVGFWGHLQSKGFRAKSIEHSKIQIGPLTLVNELITSDAACQDIDWAKNPMKPDTLKSYIVIIVGDSSISTIRSLWSHH